MKLRRIPILCDRCGVTAVYRVIDQDDDNRTVGVFCSICAYRRLEENGQVLRASKGTT